MKEEKQIQDILAEYEEATSNRKGSLKSTRTTYAKRIAALYSSEPQCHKSKTCESYGDCAACIPVPSTPASIPKLQKGEEV